MDIEDLGVTVKSTSSLSCLRSQYIKPARKKILGFEYPKQPSEDEIVADARRCVYCYDPQCSQCCPSQLKIRDFVHAAAARNFYYAAKVILTDNPLPLSTGALCAVENFCQGGCILNGTEAGAIKTNAIQLYSVRKFRDYHIKPTVKPSNGKKVAIIGAGPSGMSCAAFLKRMGFEVTIFEAESFAGGLLTKELLPFRLPHEDLEFEVQMLKDVGVKFEFNKRLGKDFTLDNLKEQGYQAFYLAIGRPDDVTLPFENNGTLSSHEFLFRINSVLKLKNGKELPNYKGKKVLILGAGDTAMDCAGAASRLGGEVTVAFRKDFKGMRAHPKEVEELMSQGIEFLPLVEPTKIDNGTVTFRLQEYCLDGSYKPLDEYITRKYDEVITAFGSTLSKSKVLIPGKINQQNIENHENIFCGGDLANSQTVVEAVNDGKNAARMIANYLGEKSPIPVFTTEVDDVSLQTELDGLKYSNPFGIASAPVSGTYECIKNSYLAGFGWAVTKTILLTKDLFRENDFRIVKCDDNPYASNSFTNICIMTEHPCEYWIDTIKKLKAEFPDKILIASIACGDNKEDWQLLTKLISEAGADGFELNLSCPNQVIGGENARLGMEIGTIPEGIKRITKYVIEVAGGKPVYPKLTPNVTNIVDLAKAAKEGGANGISTINTVSGIAKFYPDGTPLPQVGKKKLVLSGGMSGDQIRPIALRAIAKIYQALPQFTILGIGGIWNADTAMQHLYAGSSIFEICSGVQRYSYEIVQEMINGLKFILYSWSRPDLRSLLGNSEEMKNYPYHPEISNDSKPDRKVPTLSEMRGYGTKYVVEREQLEPKWTIVARINMNKCIKCGKCALSCRDNSVEAISRENGIWKIKNEKCIGCGLCLSVCPVNAIELVEMQEKEWHHM